MSNRKRSALCLAVALVALSLPSPGVGAEGFWPYISIPSSRINQRYRVQITGPLLNRVMRASARLTNGGSGSFISADGLFLTNQHIAGNYGGVGDRTQNGFLATGLDEEMPLPGTRLEAVLSISDVTRQVAGNLGSAEAASDLARRISAIEQDCTRTASRCQVVSLAHGARFELHRYRTFTDVRLVFCPAGGMAQFHSASSAPTNNMLDAYDFDICLLRAYENGVPARTPDHLQVSQQPIRPGTFVFASGFPGSSARAEPVSQSNYRREVELPNAIAAQDQFAQTLRLAIADGDVSLGGALRGTDAMLADLRAQLDVLSDPAWQARRRRWEDAFEARSRALGRPENLVRLRALQEALDRQRAEAARAFLLNYPSVSSSPEPGNPLTRSLAMSFYVRIFREVASTLAQPPQLRPARYTAPGWTNWLTGRGGGELDRVNRPFEIAVMTAWLTRFQAVAGEGDPLVRELLGGQSPHEAATRIVTGSRVGDAAFHRSLLDGDDEAIVRNINMSDDPLFVFARRLNTERSRMTSEAEAALSATRLEGEIARERYRALPDEDYPDATNTLRIGYGTVTGYTLASHRIAPIATMGQFNRWLDTASESESSLPGNWQSGRHSLSPATPLSFATSIDMASGNSGSPIVDQNGRLVGLLRGWVPTGIPHIFYDEDRSRTIGIAAAGIVEILEKIYHATDLAREINEGARPGTRRDNNGGAAADFGSGPS